mmetsp:Transcript_16297/g.26124  ORF Transcript_16297/g.26124 Transcript_16297/m.26124 type:complete len:83 (+) Transcript_16297:1745-1993(+)
MVNILHTHTTNSLRQTLAHKTFANVSNRMQTCTSFSSEFSWNTYGPGYTYVFMCIFARYPSRSVYVNTSRIAFYVLFVCNMG